MGFSDLKQTVQRKSSKLKAQSKLMPRCLFPTSALVRLWRIRTSEFNYLSSALCLFSHFRIPISEFSHLSSALRLLTSVNRLKPSRMQLCNKLVFVLDIFFKNSYPGCDLIDPMGIAASGSRQA